jgi:hypothetical protein|nr:MAG TPA: Putative HNHc nuclease [Caudoviricetes sp.]
MKSPIDVVKGTIVGYDDRTREIIIRAPYDDWFTMTKRGYSKCNVQLIDSRPLSDKQRRTCYKLIREIANYTGMGLDPAKEYLKLKFLVEDMESTADQMFSLSDAPMSLVCAFQRFLVHFIIDWDLPCSFPLLDFVDDTQDYIYACLAAKKCCVCGKQSDLHHVEHVGTGRDREDIIHEGMEVLPLCRIHHTEAHQIGQITFNRKYHIDRGVRLDKDLCKIYRLKRKKEQENAECSGDYGSAGC